MHDTFMRVYIVIEWSRPCTHPCSRDCVTRYRFPV